MIVEWQAVDYWDTVSKSHYLRVQRRWIFFWAIAWKHNTAGWNDQMYWQMQEHIGQWRPLSTFWKKETATAKLMELMLKGHNVEL